MSMEKLLSKFDSLEMNELHRAVQENNAEAVKFLVEQGDDIMNTINMGQTPLHLAASLNDFCITSGWFTNMSRKEARDCIDRRTVDTGMSPLHLAASKNLLLTVRSLLSRGANFEIRNKENRQAKQLTTCPVILGLIERIEAIFKYTLEGNSEALVEQMGPASHEFFNHVAYARNGQGFTQLHLAMEKNHLDIVSTIIILRMDQLPQDLWQAGAQIDSLMRHSKAARLHLSNLDAFCYNNSESTVDLNSVKKEVVDLLRNAYEFLDAYKDGRDRSLENQTLLITIEESLEFFGSWEKSEFIENERVDALLRKGPAFAAKMLKLSIVAPIQFFMRTVYSVELVEAVRRNDMAKVEKCLLGHPDMDARDDEKKWTVLHHALVNRNIGMFRLLLTFGANPTSACEANGETLLHFLSRSKGTSMQLMNHNKALLYKTVCSRVSLEGVNAKNSREGSTALHLAAKRGNWMFVPFLLACGAIYCAKDKRNKAPVDYCKSRSSNTLKYLRTVDRLFTLMRQNKVRDVLQVMKEAKGSAFLAYAGARDSEGLRLDQVLGRRKRPMLAHEIRQFFGRIEAISNLMELW